MLRCMKIQRSILSLGAAALIGGGAGAAVVGTAGGHDSTTTVAAAAPVPVSYTHLTLPTTPYV